MALMKMMLMGSGRAGKRAGAFRQETHSGESYTPELRFTQTHGDRHTHMESGRSGSVCRTALNLPDVGLKLNLIQSSLETMSSAVVNYLKKRGPCTA